MAPDPAPPRPTWVASRPGIPATPETAFRLARLVGIALLSGCLLLAGIVVFAVSRGRGAGVEDPLRATLVLIGWAVAGSNLLLSFVLRGRPPEEPGKRASHLVGRTILSLALNEGSVLLNLCFALVTGSLEPGFYAAAIGFAGLVLHFPTRSRFGLEP